MTKLVTPGQALWNQRQKLGSLADRLRSLIKAVDRPGDLAPFQWAQIAAFADHQYRIEKVIVDERSVTRIAILNGEDRIEELVRMMSGSRVTQAAREHVKELLKATKA